MASKRDLKKKVHYICESLAFESVIKLTEGNAAPGALTDCLLSIQALETEYIKRIGNVEKLGAKKHFAKLKSDFSDEIGKNIDKLFPSEA